MNKIRIGTIVKLSEVGLNFIYSYKPKLQEKIRGNRFEYRGITHDSANVVSVKRLTSDNWLRYHISFIEPA